MQLGVSTQCIGVILETLHYSWTSPSRCRSSDDGSHLEIGLYQGLSETLRESALRSGQGHVTYDIVGELDPILLEQQNISAASGTI